MTCFALLVGQDVAEGFISETNEKTAHTFIPQEILCFPAAENKTDPIEQTGSQTGFETRHETIHFTLTSLRKQSSIDAESRGNIFNALSKIPWKRGQPSSVQHSHGRSLRAFWSLMSTDL